MTRLTEGQGYGSGRGPDGCPGRRGLYRDDRPFSGSSRVRCCGGEKEIGHGEASGRDGGRHGHDQTRIAKRQKEGCEPTAYKESVWSRTRASHRQLPRLTRSTYLNLQDIVTAEALVVHLIISIIRVATILILDKSEAARLVNTEAPQAGRRSTYSLLELERGAGISHRTRRP